MIDIKNWRHPLQGGRSQLPSWAKPNSEWKEIALEGRDSAYFLTKISITDDKNNTTEIPVEGIIGLGPNSQPVLFSKKSVEHLLGDERRVLNVTWNVHRERTRAGVEYDVGEFKEV